MSLRRGVRWTLWPLAGLLALALLVSAWALFTSGGARFLLRRADAAMPATLSLQKLDGSVARGLRIGGFRFDDDGVRLDVDRLEVKLRILPLLARRLYVDRIFVDGARLKLWTTNKPDEPYLAMQLPIRLKLDEVLANDLVIEGLAEQAIRIDTLAFAGTWIGTHVRFERLVVTAPQGRLAFNGQVDLANLLAIDGSGSLSWQANGLAWSAALATREHATGTGVGVAITAPLRAHVTALLSGNHQDPHWQARVRLPAQVLASALTGGTPTRVALDLRGGGVGFGARLSGRGEYAGENFALSDGRLRSTPATIFVDALELSLPDRDARLRLGGRVARGGKRPDADLALTIVHLPLARVDAPVGEATVIDGRVALRGWLDAWNADAQLGAARDGLKAALQAKLRGTPERISIETARVDSGHGSLALSGEIGLVADARWQLRGNAKDFDPSVLAPEWPGAVDAAIAFDGKRGAKQPVGRLLLDKVGGELRGRPIAGEASIEFAEGGRYAGNGALRSGASRIAFDKQRLDDSRVALSLDVRSLGDLLPDARGRIAGDVVVDLDTSPPSIDGELIASDVSLADIAIGTLRLDAQASRGAAAGHLNIAATAVAVDRLRIAHVALDARGTAARHDLSLAVDSTELDATLRAQGGSSGDAWQGRLQSFELAPAGLAAWTLRQPVALAVGRRSLAMADPGICLTSAGRDACVDVDYSENGQLAAKWRIDRLPSAVIARALELAGIADLEIDSELSSEGSLARSGAGALTGSGSASLSDGRIVVRRALDPIVVPLRDVRVDVAAGASGLEARVSGTLHESGRIGGTVTIGPGLDAGSALGGAVELDFQDLAWLEALSAELANPRGSFNGRFQLGGTLGSPTYAGEGRLTKFYVEIPEYNLRLREADVRLTANADRSLAVEGTVLSGKDGSARISGRWSPAETDGERMRLHITGDNFLAANRPDLMLRVSPDLTLVAGAERIDITGTLTVPRARIDLSRVEGGRRRSTDVVVTDDPEVERRDSPIWSDVTVVAGDAVALEGFGLDGTVTGKLRVRNRPGRETTGEGTLSVLGKYEAYGQRLDIDRGRVLFNRSPLSDPRLDIRATRRVGAVTVGIKVGGTALAPDSQVYSSPAMDQSDALAYLIVGRPLRSASSDDAGAIANAAGALGGASGDLLAKSLGARMGLGDLGDSTAAFTMGRWLSPRLYLSYGISGLKGEPVFSLRYLVREWLEIEAVVGAEVRAGVNYRRER